MSLFLSLPRPNLGLPRPNLGLPPRRYISILEGVTIRDINVPLCTHVTNYGGEGQILGHFKKERLLGRKCGLRLDGELDSILLPCPWEC